MDRRDFLTAAGGVLFAGAASTVALKVLTSSELSTTEGPAPGEGKRWGMVIDLDKCVDGCRECIGACRNENNVAHFDDERWDIHWLRKVTVESESGSQPMKKEVLLLCNHCDKPPCAQVCPVQATYKREDGVVIVDHHRCIGCRYCMVACPYNARYFNFKETSRESDWPNKEFPKRKHGVAEACTLCAHLLDVGREPACVTECKKVGADAILVGDLNDPESEISKVVANRPVKRLREGLGTEPKVYYLGL